MDILAIIKIIDVNIFSLIILIILLSATMARQEKGMVHHRLFELLLILNILLNVLEILGWVFDASAGMNGASFRTANLVFNLALYCFAPVPVAVWYLYAHFQIHQDLDRLRRAMKVLLVPLLLDVLLSMLSLRTGWFFSVDAGNYYHRGPYFLVHVFVVYGILIAACLLVIINRKLLERRIFRALLLYILPPAIGASLQSLFYGITWNWASMMISVLIIYLHIQDRGLKTDYLTGTFNRRHFEQIIANRIRRVGIEPSFAVVLCDMDNFKKINDRFGHKTGDEALQIAVKLLRRTLRKDDLIARFGGDEFYLLLELADKNALRSAINRIYQEFERYNQGSGLDYRLELSIGGAIYDSGIHKTAEQFLGHVDQLMYQEKARRQQKLPIGP